MSCRHGFACYILCTWCIVLKCFSIVFFCKSRKCYGNACIRIRHKEVIFHNPPHKPLRFVIELITWNGDTFCFKKAVLCFLYFWGDFMFLFGSLMIVWHSVKHIVLEKVFLVPIDLPTIT